MQSSYRNLGYILLVFPLIIVAGFWIPYFSQIPQFDSSITTAVHSLILFDRRRHLAARPYAVALATYIVVETGWVALGRPV
jgi:hypothetical protein